MKSFLKNQTQLHESPARSLTDVQSDATPFAREDVNAGDS